MKRYIKHIIAVTTGAVLTVAAVLPASGRTAEDFFKDAPAEALPLLRPTDRLDMLDYYNSGSDRHTQAMLGTGWRITSLSERQLVMECDSASGSVTVTVAVLPAGRDTAVAVISTVALPAHDSNVDIYLPSGNKVILSPDYSDWWLPGALDGPGNIETTLPFVTATASVDGSSVTFTNTAAEYLAPADTAAVLPLLRPTLTYEYTKGKLKLRR